MKKNIVVLALIAILVFFVYKKVYVPYLWQKAIQTPEHKLQVGSFIFSFNKTLDANTFLRTTQYQVQIITEIKGDYVRLAAIEKLYLPNQIQHSLPSRNDNYYENLKSTISDKIISPVTINYKLMHQEVTKELYLSKFYPKLQQFPFYYEIYYENKPLFYDSNEVPYQYLDHVYSKKEIIENGKLVRYTLTNVLDGVPVLYDLGEKIELIKNKI